MKLFLLGFAAAALMLVAGPTAFAQEEDASAQFHAYTKTIPLPAADAARARRSFNASSAAVANGSTIPMWNYTITAPKDGNTYSGTMVGASPYFNGARTVSIPTVVIPLIIVMSDGSTFDPTTPDNCAHKMSSVNLLMGSPIFQSSAFTMNGINIGSGQYVDEFQRANFYEANVSETGDSYHNNLAPVTVLPAQTLQMPSGLGASYFMGGCTNLGVIDFNTFNSMINSLMTSSALTSQGVKPTSLPLFLVHNVVMANPGDSPFGNCCVVGYHGATGSPTQTYIEADMDSTGNMGTPDIAAVSHEVGEWMDDPIGNNPTPAWGHTGQVGGCQSNLEVGDPLTGTQFNIFGVPMPNGISYGPQQLAFFSWFFDQTPSLGTGGMYSNAGTFPVGSHTCTS